MLDETSVVNPPAQVSESPAAPENDSPANGSGDVAVGEVDGAVGDPVGAAGSETQRKQESGEAFLAELRDALAGLRRDFESKLLYDAGKQRQLDILHEELEQHRRGFHLQLLRPVITDLITLYSDMEKVAARLASQEAHVLAAQEITQFRDQVEEILRRNSVERFTSPSDTFDAGRQRAVAVVETSDQASDKRIAERLRPGFEYEGRIVVQAEQVKTYRYVAPAVPDEQP